MSSGFVHVSQRLHLVRYKIGLGLGQEGKCCCWVVMVFGTVVCKKEIKRRNHLISADRITGI